MLDFVQFINDNVANLTPAQKVAMLEDFCLAFGYDGSDKTQFANARITRFIKDAVHKVRKNQAIIETLDLGNGTVVLP